MEGPTQFETTECSGNFFYKLYSYKSTYCRFEKFQRAPGQNILIGWENVLRAYLFSGNLKYIFFVLL